MKSKSERMYRSFRLSCDVEDLSSRPLQYNLITALDENLDLSFKSKKINFLFPKSQIHFSTKLIIHLKFIVQKNNGDSSAFE